MGRKLIKMVVPSWYSVYDRDSKKSSFIRRKDDIVIDCYETNGIFAITKPVPGNITQYTITHIITGFTAHWFDTLEDARKCVERFSNSQPHFCDSWAGVDTPEKLMLQVDWMRDVVKELKGLP